MKTPEQKKQAIEAIAKSGKFESVSAMANSESWIKTFLSNQKSESQKVWKSSLVGLIPAKKPDSKPLPLPIPGSKPSKDQEILALVRELNRQDAYYLSVFRFAQVKKAFPDSEIVDQSDKLPAIALKIEELKAKIGIAD
jgi:hypothetical protein